MTSHRRLMEMFPRLCLSCLRRWGTSAKGDDRACPFCGSAAVTTVKRPEAEK